MTYQEMVQATKQQIDARNGARDELAARIEAILDDLLHYAGVDAVDVAGYRIEWRTVAQDCSQWSWRVDYPGLTKTATVITRGPERALARSFGQLDLSFWDGNNMQYGRGHVTLGDAVVRPATVAMLHAIAAGLPEVAARLHSDRQQILTAQTATADAAKSALDAALK